MKREEFTHRWVGTILTSIDAHLNDATRYRLLESCGRACARSGAAQSAEACRGDLDKLLTTLGSWIGNHNVVAGDGTIEITYERCFCQLKTEVPEQLEATYCLCSVGWLKEIFETVTGTSVDVELRSSIKRGAECCSFVVSLPKA